MNYLLKKCLAMGTTAALAVGLAFGPVHQAEAAAFPLLKVGQKNNSAQVKDVQSRLKQLGLYHKQVTGTYDAYTRDAVIQFQKKRHLKWIDGIVGPETTGTLKKDTYSQQEINLLARAVYSESRGEPFEGQVAVAAVVLNRVDHKDFPNTVKGVIYEPGAFTAVKDGQINLKPNATAYQAVAKAIRGSDPTGGAVYYYNPQTASSRWMKNQAKQKRTLKIGQHVFLK
ncbi:cell wall hydrolase [Paenactinomyces guangxiensis]|uniref:Cell wall hydrolase n=1 Tax=Paenactinomyces guangxiensis TaxID=1490290 RepID=A0A7W1WMP8_9BACL|nr:cell wall hydrolase [Paenactinomyces guangxiensis]MBA4492758.1 cell wall hydrolase [Paenactinomyces guangxiensis]MBH8590393.1 cell wall hydrolase [Paenactinomyces guangxiensis]